MTLVLVTTRHSDCVSRRTIAQSYCGQMLGHQASSLRHGSGLNQRNRASSIDLADSFQGYFSFGSSATNHVVAAGVLRGRPYGDVAVLVKEHLRSIATMVISEERFCEIRTQVLYTPKKSDKLAFKLRIRQGFNSEKSSFSNDLHEALSHKSGNDFWNSWRSKFGTANKQPHQINCLADERDVANKFAESPQIKFCFNS